MQKTISLLSCLILIPLLSLSALAQETDPSPPAEVDSRPGGVKSLEDRIRHLEEDLARVVKGDKWYERLKIGGLIEFEAGYQKSDFADPAAEDETAGDLDLATAELNVDAGIVEHVDGHVMIKFEEDKLFLDEGFVALSGGDAFPAVLIAGRQYIPFGYFESHFVTDPTTLLLAETNEGALVAGYWFGGGVNDLQMICRGSLECKMMNVSIGVFNGKIDKAGADDTIDSFVASIVAKPWEPFTIGASYTSNLASADAFSEVVTGPVDRLVGGWSAFAVFQFLGRFKLIGEYVAALESF